MKRTLLTGVLALAILGALVALHATGGHGDIAAPSHLALPEEGVTLPMPLLGGRPLVDVTIHGQGPYRFILDTAASCSVVDVALQDALGLPSRPMAAATPGGSEVKLVTVDELRVGGARLSGLTAAVMPVAGLFPAEPRPQGVLSALAFPGYLVTFDYPAGKIRIAQGALGTANGRDTFAYGAADPIPRLPLRIAGREVAVHLDTGADGGLTLPRRYLEALPLASPPAERGKTRTPMGETSVVVASIGGPIRLGGHTLDLAEARFGDLDPGTLGYAALRRFVVTLDSRHRRVRLTR